VTRSEWIDWILSSFSPCQAAGSSAGRALVYLFASIGTSVTVANHTNQQERFPIIFFFSLCRSLCERLRIGSVSDVGFFHMK